MLSLVGLIFLITIATATPEECYWRSGGTIWERAKSVLHLETVGSPAITRKSKMGSEVVLHKKFTVRTRLDMHGE